MAKVKSENSKELLKELDIKKEDLIKDIKKNIKDDLYDDISNRVDYEAKNKLDKMEKRIYRIKNLSILKRNIIILIFLAIIIYQAKILYDNNLLFNSNKKINTEITQNKNDKDSNTDKDIIKKDSKWYIDNYSYLLDNVKTNLDIQNKFYLYEKDHKINSIDNKVKLNMAYQLLEDTESDNGVIRVNDDKLKEAYKKIFGRVDTYKQESFSNSCVQFVFNKSINSYIALDMDCEDSNEEILRVIKNISENDGKLIIEAYVGIYNKDSNKIKNINGKKYYEYNNSDSLDNLYTYNFTFEKSDEDYYLSEITKNI